MIKKRYLLIMIVALSFPTLLLAVKSLISEGDEYYKKFDNAKAFAARNIKELR